MSDTASALADAVAHGFEDYRRRFTEITRRAEVRFRDRDWAEAQEDARERILLYDVVVHETLSTIRKRNATESPPPPQAARARATFARWARERGNCEIAQTFYNSVIRRLYGTVGVDPGIEFVAADVDDPVFEGPAPWREIPVTDGFRDALDRALATLPLDAPWHDRDRRLDLAAGHLQRELGPDEEWTPHPATRWDMSWRP